MGRGYLVVEGHGEVKAAVNLVTRLWSELGLRALHWAEPWRGKALNTREGISRVCALVRQRDADVLLLLRDEDDGCPKELGPKVASWLEEEKLDFPAAVVLMHREYETLFLPCLPRMAGRPMVDDRGIARPGIVLGAEFLGNVESVRDAKGTISRFFPKGRIYKPAMDQLPLTRMLDFGDLRQANVPCFGTLERALQFLGEKSSLDINRVYPHAP
jgi:hypothetical protein